ncbi:MAG: dehydrogenase [Luteitalea sp.]|nr:dehydrogenase [Luteitalea sp.]
MGRNIFVSRRVWMTLASAIAWSVSSLSPAHMQVPDQPTEAPPQAAATGRATDARPIKLLFLGHDQEQPHPSASLFSSLAPTLTRRGIQLTHVWTPAEALTVEKLAHYDALMIYGDHQTITPEQEQALLDFVVGGKGLVAIHSASAMFPTSDRYISLVGAQTEAHGTGGEAVGEKMTAEIVEPSHPVMRELQPFEAWDEAYAHTKHNPADRTVLMNRVGEQGREPWTWVRTQGKGRVFYSAYGHDQRTWENPAFQKLIEQGIVWAVDDATRTSWERLQMPEVSYVDGFNVPNYEKRDPPPKYQLPFTPEESMTLIQTPAEFRLELFASEPDIIKPISFSFDERGRLWVIETLDYPNKMLDGQPGNDRIKILEDTDEDGRADKVTVFADHLNIPTSFVFANGGVIVSGAPHFLFLKDTDGDDKADVREVLSTGWGTEDTHAGPSNLQYGPDNYIWGVVGYSGYDGEMNAKRLEFDQGAYRFKPDGSAFEVMTGSTNNTWGLGFSETFDVFGSTANNDPSWYLAIANRFFEGIEGLDALPGGRRSSGPGYQSLAQFYAMHYTTPYIRQVDVHGGYTSAAGHHLYTARSFPKDYWNRIAFISEPTGHLIGQGILEEDGASFVTRDGWYLVAGAEEWFSPVHTQVGPDGAVWVADWYNFIQQHNPTPPGHSVGRGNAYETSMRDHLRGRIYRVVYKNARPAEKRALSKTDPAGLLDALAADNMFWRLTAQRLLVERAQKDIVPQLLALVRDPSVDEIGINGGAFHALWTLHGLGELTSTDTDAYRVAVEALKHPAAGVRKAAAMVLPRTAESGTVIVAADLLQDPDLHTRLAATLALAEMPASPSIGEALYTESQNAESYGDKWLSRALYIAAYRHKDGFLTSYKADEAALPFSELPISLRMGPRKPDWRVPASDSLTADWTDVQVPGNWEARGLPEFDGVVWFTRSVDVTEAGAASTLALGQIGDAAELWINGSSVMSVVSGGRRGGRKNPPPYQLPDGVLRAGQNTITVRVQNFRDDGGFLGPPESMYIQSGEQRTPLAGTWKYRVERQSNAAGLYTKPGELAAHVAFAAGGGIAATAEAALPPEERQTPDVVLKIGVIPGEMKYDRSELNVTPGQVVEIVFTNPDALQHNFVLGVPGSLEQIGLAADRMAASPDGLAQQYVPDMSQVLFATDLVDPGETVTVQFRAPTQPGEYPYVCTFPAHWQVMNGLLKVAGSSGGGE